jgi:hypothetical protein
MDVGWAELDMYELLAAAVVGGGVKALSRRSGFWVFWGILLGVEEGGSGIPVISLNGLDGLSSGPGSR